jgi:lipid-A-disaccharide synthase
LKYYIIAGESSGDLHASNLMLAIQKEDAHADFRFWGGDKMYAVFPSGLVKHIKDLAFMGFLEVLLHLRTILKNLSFCKQDIIDYQPDAVIFIDYPGFNLRITQFCKENNLKTFYYISPQIWAWKENRIEIIRKYVDKMYVILPFEEKFYRDRGFHAVQYVGHPLLDEVVEKTLIFSDPKKQQIAVLPGSPFARNSKNAPGYE